MVIGRITIYTCYGYADIPVEVVRKGSRPGTAWVKALNGLEPFTKVSHGGPYQDDTLVISLALIQEVQLAGDPEDEQAIEIPAGLIGSIPHRIADWFPESAYEYQVGRE
jgi:hypothetical protein